MPGVRIVTDSSCDLPAERASAAGIEIVPLTIRFGEEELVDRRDLTPTQFWQRCAAASELPQTAAPSPGAFEQAFRAQAEAGADAVLCLTISSHMSATGQSAQAAAAQMADLQVRVVDSQSVSLGLGLICLQAAELAAQGASLDEVVAHAADLSGRTRIFATLDTLDHLRKGGRIGGAQALLGSLLSVKPVIEVRDGKVEAGPKVRTRTKALKFLADQVAAAPGVERVAVMHGEAPDVGVLLEQLTAMHPDGEIIVGDLGPVVGAHTGPRTVGVIFQVR